MENINILKKFITPLTFIVIGAVARIIPHAPNFAPIGAMALFGAAYMNKKQAFILPILAMVLSDFVIGFDSIPMRLIVYGTFIIMVLIGLWLKSHLNAKNVIFSSLSASCLFFITTNFAVWAFGSMYPHNFGGLTESYFLAIPFFRNTVMGDLFYTGAFFGGYEFLKNFSNVGRAAWAQKL
jgi:hypothetical protein